MMGREPHLFMRLVSRETGGLKRSSMSSPLPRAQLFILGVASFSFSSCPSYDLFWCNVAVNKNTAFLRQSV